MFKLIIGATAALATEATAQPAFLITQGNTMYRYQSGLVQSFPIADSVGGMTTVPAGMTVGNVNGGASAGDALALGANGVYRVDDPLGTPTLTYIGPRGGPNASPVFVNGHLYGVGGVAGPGSIVVEWDRTFAEINRWSTGIFGGPGGMVSVPGTTDEFYYAEFNYDQIFHYKLGDTVSTPVCSTPNHDYVGMEDYQGTIYCSFALPATQQFVFGTLSLTGTWNQLAVLDTYNVGITGLTWVVPSPGGLGVLAGAGLLALRRRRAVPQ